MTGKPKLARLAPALLYTWYGTALLSMPAGLLLAVASGWAGSWPMLGASFVLFLYAAFAVRLLVGRVLFPCWCPARGGPAGVSGE